MGDYYQRGVIATLHNLTQQPVEFLERHLVGFAERRPMTLILPSLFSELEGPALENIVEELQGASYLSEIIIGLDRADADRFAYAKDYFSKLPQRHSILWNDGPRMAALHQELEACDLHPQEAGKGRNVWYCLGYALASRHAEVIALHDCDIVTYSREMLARLLYPVSNPDFSYVFCKGYYPRISNGMMTGRVTRLLVSPLLTALRRTVGPHEYLEYLESFRYPLAGECAMRTSVVPDIRIPSDWGLEIGILSEVRRNYASKVICQVDIADRYDHKHQPLSQEDPRAGLSRMSTDIAKAIFRKLAADGVVFSQETFRTLKACYLRAALDLIEFYYTDARMNGLVVDRHKEEQAVELFAANIVEAGQLFLENPMQTPFIPSWNRIQSALPDFLRQMHEAVALDLEESRTVVRGTSFGALRVGS